MTIEASELDRNPVPPDRLEPARRFAASSAGEHVAGTEFVIGAMFVAWGVGTSEVFWGLLVGNLLAVFTWGLICAPIAVQTRLTLYAYLERIGGPGFIKLYSGVNGVLFCVLAGAMITVSASAVRILFDIAPQTDWYPSSAGFVAVAIGVGTVVVAVAMKGFRQVARFAGVCTPWMIAMFVAGALAMLPVLLRVTPGVSLEDGLDGLKRVADTHIWRAKGSELSAWHVGAFAWICNLAMHGGLSDMTVLRFARKSSYGFLSVLGMFIGHFLAWICAGVMGAGAALMLKSNVADLDAGAVAFQALGAAGILAVIIAGWTTSNPTLYRAGLAFQSLRPSWSRSSVTLIAGLATTFIACFPFVFTKLMDFVGLMGLALAPVGAVVVAEHWLFPRLGLTRYWVFYAERRMNWAAVLAWSASLVAAWLLHGWGIHLFFLLLPTWLVATAVYVSAAATLGARADYGEMPARFEVDEAERRRRELEFLRRSPTPEPSGARARGSSASLNGARAAVVGSLAACLALPAAVLLGIGTLAGVHSWLLLPTGVYFAGAIAWSLSLGAERRESPADPGLTADS